MTAFAIFTPPGDSQFEVHRHGCRDIARKDAFAPELEPIEADSVDEAIATYLDENDGELRDMGYDETFFDVLPCASKAARS